MEKVSGYEKTSILITGAAGFIGANLAIRLLSSGGECRITGIDNLNSYYEVSLKRHRLEKIDREARCSTQAEWEFVECDITDKKSVREIFAACRPDIVVNLAAQAGVRFSIENPDAYIESNVLGFFNILEACRHSYDDGRSGVGHLVYASSSSVYGGDDKVPFSTADNVDRPVSLYAATKKSDELLAYCYSKLYGIPSTGLRFFTVYGPAGRPDMAYFAFTDKLRRGEEIRIFNYGNCQRDFTYVDDIVEGLVRVLRQPPQRRIGGDGLLIAPHAVYNIGNGHPVSLLDFIDILQQELIRAGVLPEDYDFDKHKKLVPMQPGDVPVTYADTKDLERDFGFKPEIDLREGLRRFARWYKEYYIDHGEAENKRLGFYGYAGSVKTGFNYLYPLHAILYERNPMNILEFHIGDDTGIASRYTERTGANHSVVEQSRNAETVKKIMLQHGVSSPKTKVYLLPLLPARTAAAEGVIFRNFPKIAEGQRYDLILLKCPGFNRILFHLDLLQYLPSIMADDFAILMDHVEESNGRSVLQDMENILQAHGIVYEKKFFPERKRVVCLLQSVSHGGANGLSIVSLERWQEDIRALQSDRIYLLGLNLHTLSLAWEVKRATGKQIAILRTDGGREHSLFQGIPCLPADGIDRGGVLFVPNFYQGAQEAAMNWKQRFRRQGEAIILDMRTAQAHLDAMDDESYLRCQWYCLMGYEIDLASPRTFNEKLQWLKLHDRQEKYVQMVDKYAVKKYAEKKIGKQYLIPTLGIWNHFEDINFDELPQSFVLKCTHDSGSVILVRNKDDVDKKNIRDKLERALSRNYYWNGREWPYKHVEPRIIAEPFMMNESGTELNDYKVFCFDGKIALIQVDFDRFHNHRRNLYTVDWEYIDASICYPTDASVKIERPACLAEMLELARTLSQGIPHVRVDFYIVAGRLYLGELTFYHGSGYEKFTPIQLDRKLGDWIKLPE